MRKQVTLEPESPEMSRESQIQILERQLADPDCSARSAAALSRQISILKGDVTPGVYIHSTAEQQQRKLERRKAEQAAHIWPTQQWLDDQEAKGISWLRIWLSERIAAQYRRGATEFCPEHGSRIKELVAALWESFSPAERAEWLNKFWK